MDINFNLGFLKTVKAPVADSFKSAQEGIKDALSSAKAGAQGGFNFTFMKDFLSTQSMFKMIGLHGLYAVTGVVIEVLTAVREGKLDSEKLPHILSVTNETVRNLSFYVEQLLQGGADQPLSLYADYEKLSKFINKEVAQKDLFFPRLDWEDKSLVLDLVDFFKPARVLSVEESKAMYSEISAQRLIVQKGIADVFPLLEKLNDPAAAKVMHDKCRIMFDALNKAQGIKFNKSYYLLGLLQKLFVCSISPNLNDKISHLATSENLVIKHALAKLEKELKVVCQALNENTEGEHKGNLKPANIRPDEETVRDLLFFLSSVVKLNPKFKEIQIYKEVAKVFPLDFYLKQLNNLSFSVTAAQKNPEILAQLEKVFSETKEEVVMMTSKAGGSFDQIFVHVNKLAAFLSRVDELFNSLNVSSLQPTTQALLEAVVSIKNKQAQFTHEVASEMSLLVVMLENGINDYVKAYAPESDYVVLSHQLEIQIARLNFALNNRLPELEQAQSPEMDARSRKSDERKAFESVFHELAQNFAHVEEMLDEFFRSNGENLGDIKEILHPLAAARGVFLMTGKPELVKMVGDLHTIFSQVADKGMSAVSSEVMRRSANALSGIVLYVKELQDDNLEEADNILAATRALLKGDLIDHNVTQNTIETERVSEHASEPASLVNEEKQTTINETPSLVSLVDYAAPSVAPSLVEEKIFTSANKVVLVDLTSGDLDRPQELDLAEVYIEEANEIVANLAIEIPRLDHNRNDNELLTSIRRAFHTLKGSGRMVKLMFLGEAGWMVEQTINKYNADAKAVDDGMIHMLWVAQSHFKAWIESLAKNGEVRVNLLPVLEAVKAINPSIAFSLSLAEKQSVISIKDSNKIDNNFVLDNSSVTAAIPLDVLVNEAADEVADTNVIHEADNVEVLGDVIVENDYLLIDGVEISKSLYALFDEEAASHIAGLVKQAGLLHESDEPIFSEELMRHAHTLGSISAAVNLKRLSDVNRKLEAVVKIAQDKEIVLSKEEVRDIDRIINFIPLLRQDQSNVHSEQFSVTMSLLANLENKFISFHRPDVVMPATEHHAEIKGYDSVVSSEHVETEEELNAATPELSLVLDNQANLNNGNQSFELSEDSMRIITERMTQQIRDIILEELANKENKESEIVENISNNIVRVFEEKNQAMLENLTNLEKRELSSQETVQNVVNQFNELKSSVEKMQTQQTELAESQHKAQQVFSHNLGVVRKEVQGLSTEVKKKSEDGLEGDSFRAVSLGAASDPVHSSELSDLELESLIDAVYGVEETDEVEVVEEMEEMALKIPTDEELSSVNIELYFSPLEEGKEEEEEGGRIDSPLVSSSEILTTREIQGIDTSNLDLNLDSPAEKVNSEKEEEKVESETLLLNTSDVKIQDDNRVEALKQTKKEIQEIDTSNLDLNLDSPADKIHSEKEEEKVEFDFETLLLNTSAVKIQDDNRVEALKQTPSLKSNKKVSFFAGNQFVRTIFEDLVGTQVDDLDHELLVDVQEEINDLMEKICAIMDKVGTEFIITQNQELKRYLHTVKGSAKMAGANKIGGVAHRLESLLEYSERHNIALYQMHDLIAGELEKISFLFNRMGSTLDESRLRWLDLVDLGNDEEEMPVALMTEKSTVLAEKDFIISAGVEAKKETQPVFSSERLIRVSSEVLDSMVNEAGEIRLTRSNLEGTVDSMKRMVSEFRSSSGKLLQILKEIEIQAETQITAKKVELEELGENFDPLEFDRFTRLQELTRFMAETVNDIDDTVLSAETVVKKQDVVVSQQNVLTTNLLSELMRVRLVPFDNITERLIKLTRSTSREVGKQVRIEFNGEKTEIDRIVLDRIVNPLEHLVRNCIAHGIETPEERSQAGKTAFGRIFLDTRLEGNFISLTIRDDGRGINLEKVRELAIQKNLAQAGRDYTQQELIDFIFAPGFSTMDKVTQVAGRGVGMDIVKSEIVALGGSVYVTTIKDKGTTFVINLPVSVATSQVMLSEVNNRLVAIPALLVDRVVSLKKIKMEQAYQEGQIKIENIVYELNYCGHLLGSSANHIQPDMRQYNMIVLVSYLNGHVALHVDKLYSTTEVLVKGVGSQLGKIPGFIGATILGDGRQGMIINPVLLKNHWNSLSEKANNSLSIDSVNSTVKQKDRSKLTVMIVDDSLTVRKTTAKVLERNGYLVVSAKDGEDALEQLQVVIPDIILSDIEMPKMDGFEFVKIIRTNKKYKAIPVIMITSRTADKHRNYAKEIGANGFLGKPYQEEELIENIKQLTEKSTEIKQGE